MKIADIMTRQVITVSPDDPVRDCVELFTDSELHHAPVTSSEGEVLGMLSSKDLENYTTITEALEITDAGGELKVRDLMTTPIFSYYEDTSLREAARAMRDNHIHAVVVMNREDEMSGIITSTDIVNYAADYP